MHLDNAEAYIREGDCEKAKKEYDAFLKKQKRKIILYHKKRAKQVSWNINKCFEEKKKKAAQHATASPKSSNSSAVSPSTATSSTVQNNKSSGNGEKTTSNAPTSSQSGNTQSSQPKEVPQTIPIISTEDVYGIEINSAKCGGNVSHSGGASVTACGICWSQNPHPTTSDFCTKDGSGAGRFSSYMRNLLPGTDYYVRAYAVNSVGTAYGQEVKFRTKVAKPTISRALFTYVTSSDRNDTVKVNFEVNCANGVNVTEAGVFYSTSPSAKDNGDKKVIMQGCGKCTWSLAGYRETSYYLCPYAVYEEGTIYGEEVVVRPSSEEKVLNKQTCGTVTDYDGNTYRTVQIGSQCWMSENLRTTHFANGTLIPQGYNSSVNAAYWIYPEENSYNKSKYGLLYNWAASMGTSAASNRNPSGVQGICPKGWHIPSDAEWSQMIAFLENQPQYGCKGNSDKIAKSLASSYGWSFSTKSCSIGERNPYWPSNASGFSAVPAGYCAGGGAENLGLCAYFRSASQTEDGYPRCMEIWSGSTTVEFNATSKSVAYSVRCVRD